MKAKTMLGLIACASACVSLSAFANTTNGWFGVTVSSETVTPVNITVDGAASVSGSKINLTDVAQDSAIVFTPTAGTVTNCTDDIYVIGASVALTPCSTNDFPAVTSAKAGVVVGFDDNNVTSYYGYASGESDKWVKLNGADVAAPGQDTTFAIVLNYRDNKVNFMIRKIVEENPVDTWFGPYSMEGGASALANIKAWGTGSISSVTGAFEVAVAAYGDNKYGSIAEAVAEAKKDSKTADDVQAVDDTGVAKDKGAKASNGLNLVVCEAMGLPTGTTEDVATIKLESASKSHAGNITLAWKKPEAAEDGVTIKFQVMNGDTKVGDPCDWDDIQIPMESGTYTVVPSIQ